ncbi:MAG: N-acetyl-gamma-glutamyl-phosphate reductase [Gammaproteobacteria bacterium]|nr:N-acetyl-gamma-glutamyl-phosphate reductase [Gammaproteobacteria bacterium]
MISAGIVGASGYMGGEALRVLIDHPQVEIAWATSRRSTAIAEFHPNLYGSGIELIHPDEADACDIVFMTLPAAPTVDMTGRFLAANAKVIDLGSAFRLRDRQTWERVYDMTHPAWSLAEKAVYGLSELHLDEIAEAQLIANPGCFSSAVILGLAPAIAEGLIDTEKLVVAGLSGTAGVGAELARAAHHPEIANNLVAYNVVGHRHTFEMEQELNALSQSPVHVHFTPVYVPITRGILSICRGFLNTPTSRQDLLDLYREYYQPHPFVEIYDLPKEPSASWQYKPYPWVSAIAGTNYCHIGLDVDEERNSLVVFSALDSIGKGGAQAGIENMNLMFGLDRTTGLTRRGLHPN